MKIFLLISLLSICSTRAMGRSQNRAKIGNTIRKNISKFYDCYRLEKMNGSKLQGDLVLVFTVMADGRVQKAGVGSSDWPISLKACLIETIYEVPFSPLLNVAKINVRQPLKFTRR